MRKSGGVKASTTTSNESEKRTEAEIGQCRAFGTCADETGGIEMRNIDSQSSSDPRDLKTDKWREITNSSHFSFLRSNFPKEKKNLP